MKYNYLEHKYASIYTETKDGKMLDAGIMEFSKTLKESKEFVLESALKVCSVTGRSVKEFKYDDYYGNQVRITMGCHNGSIVTYYNGSLKKIKNMAKIEGFSEFIDGMEEW